MDKQRLALGDRLRELREDSGLSGRRLAERAGWPASKVSRIENAKQSVSDSDVRIWCGITGAPEPVTAALRDQLRSLRLEEATRRPRVRRSRGTRLGEGAHIEQAATTIRVFEIAVVPALVQTAEYARHVLDAVAGLGGGPADPDLALRARMELQRVLYTPGKQIEIIMTEAALRLPICPPEVLCAQLDRLLALHGLPGLRLGVIPLDVPLPVPSGHGFRIVDDAVLVTTLTREFVVRDAQQVATYHRLADALASVALVGTDAAALLGRIATGLHTF